MGPENSGTDDNGVPARTERLYWFLRNMGLVVKPMFTDSQMSALLVSCEEVAKGAAQGGVVAPMEGPEIGGRVGSTKSRGLNVVDFPTEI